MRNTNSSSGYFGIPNLLLKNGVVQSPSQATSLAKMILISLSLLTIAAAAWFFIADETVDRSEPYYEYEDVSDVQ